MFTFTLAHLYHAPSALLVVSSLSVHRHHKNCVVIESHTSLLKLKGFCFSTFCALPVLSKKTRSGYLASYISLLLLFIQNIAPFLNGFDPTTSFQGSSSTRPPWPWVGRTLGTRLLIHRLILRNSWCWPNLENAGNIQSLTSRKTEARQLISLLHQWITQEKVKSQRLLGRRRNSWNSGRKYGTNIRKHKTKSSIARWMSSAFSRENELFSFCWVSARK